MFVVKQALPPETADGARIARHKEIHDQLNQLFNSVRDQIRTEELQEAYKNLRFTRGPSGRMYPHVTDILYWDAEFYINPDELAQYGARGSAIHAMIENWIHLSELKGGRFEVKKPEIIWGTHVINKRDMILLKSGSLRLIDTLGDINFLGFMEKHGKDITFGEGEFRAFNDEHFYCGQPDRVGTYQGVPAIFDFKCRAASDDFFKQMAAYLHMDDLRLKDTNRMVIIPLNPENQCGYGKPVVSDEVDKYFNLFLRDRQDFKDKFGI